MNLWANALSDTGRVRAQNEDRFFCDPELGVFAVADGIGGKPGGQVASQTVIDGINDRAADFRRFVDARFPDNSADRRDEIFDYLFEELQSINYDVFQRGTSNKYPRGIGCTVDMVVLAQGGAFILHVGDSRVYLLRDDNIFRVTRDHTYAERLLESPDINQQRLDPEKYKNVLTRSIGKTPRVKVDRLFLDMEPGQRLLLCSDGITKYFSDPQILAEARSSQDSDLPRRLIEGANERGGADNSTVVLVAVQPGAGGAFDRAPTQRDTFGQARFLQSLELFSELELQEMLKVLRYVRSLNCQAGEPVIDPADPVEGLYFVIQGKVEVRLGQVALGMLGPGEHFGEISLFGDEAKRPDARCIDDAEILLMPRESLYRLVREDPVLGNKLLWRLLARTSSVIQELLGRLG